MHLLEGFLRDYFALNAGKSFGYHRIANDELATKVSGPAMNDVVATT